MPLRQDWQLTKEERIARQERDAAEILKRLSPSARNLFLAKTAIELEKKDAHAIVEYDDGDYERQPVDIHEFIHGQYYLGSILQDSIFPKIEDDLDELFAGEYFEVLLKGAIGYGKSTMAYIGIAYDIYKVSCLRIPAKKFGLIPGTSLAFLNISVRKMQAQKILFGGLFNLIRNSPYFNKEFPYNREIESELRFPRGVIAYPVAANEQSILGEGVFSAAMDEINFYQVTQKSAQDPEGGTYDQAVVLYKKISTRIRSRMNQRGKLPGHLWMVSSSRYPTEFTETKAVEALSDKRIFVREHTAWDTKPRHFFMTQTFQVEVGDVSRRSRVLIGEEVNVNKDRILTVPMDFYDDFVKDPDKQVRDLGGIAILTIRPFISRRELIAEMLADGAAMGLKHPYSAYTVTLQDANEHLIPENLHWVEETVKEPFQPAKVVRHLHGGPYYFHIDLALTGDACGLVVCHVVGSKKIPRGYGPDRRFETRPIIRLDLVLQIVAPPRGEILLSSVRGVLYKLRELGMQFGKGSYDSWNSAESRQTLTSEGFSVDTYSVDREPSAYEELREALYDGRLQAYPHPILEKELATLIFDEKKNKIDHVKGGSKDCSDGAAGAVHHAEESFAGGSTSEWASILTVNSSPVIPELEDQDALWDKIHRGIPLSPQEIAALK